MRWPKITCLGLAALALTACATGGEGPSGPRSLAEAQGREAPPQARFYADCITEAATSRTYDREGSTLRFRCSGAAARAFYEGLAAWSAKAGSQYEEGGRIYRFTSPMERNPSGLDFCWTDGGGEHRCTVVLRVGEFLDSGV
jgi:hypothetical protein